jgi:hypothetical protein
LGSGSRQSGFGSRKNASPDCRLPTADLVR